MFRQIRYQTGETDEIKSEMEKGNIPCMDVDNMEDFYFFVGMLSGKGVFLVDSVPFDTKARDRVKEPEFEFRAAFTFNKSDLNKEAPINLVFIDFYFEPEVEESYDSIMGD